MLEAALASEDVATWVETLGAAGIPAGEVGDIGSALALAERLGLAPTMDLGAGTPPQVRHPVRFGRSTLRPPTRPPRLGEHNDRIRGWLATAETPGARPQPPERDS